MFSGFRIACVFGVYPCMSICTNFRYFISSIYDFTKLLTATFKSSADKYFLSLSIKCFTTLCRQKLAFFIGYSAFLMSTMTVNKGSKNAKVWISVSSLNTFSITSTVVWAKISAVSKLSSETDK